MFYSRLHEKIKNRLYVQALFYNCVVVEIVGLILIVI